MWTSALSGVLVGMAMVGGAAGYPLNAKRALVTETVVVTASAILYVDENGVPIYTSISEPTAGISNSAPQSAVVPTSTPIDPALNDPVASFSSSAPVVPSTSIPTTSATPSQVTERPAEYTPVSTPASPSTSVTLVAPVSPTTPVSQPPSSDRFPLGITYDTFKGSSTSVECKSTDEMIAEFEKMKEFGIVRIYGNDCGVIPVAIQQAKKNGQKLMAGIYTPNQKVNDVVSALSDAVHQLNDGDWSIISLVSVENERVNSRVATVAEVQNTFYQAREAFSKVGYNGLIGPVETVPAVVNNPDLCDKSDLTLVNIHAFFDPNTKAEDAGPFVKSEVERVRKACPNKRVVVTESGWPHQGTNHDKAVVSKSAQAAAINSIKATFDHDLFLFNAFDSPWKTDDGSTFNSERYWGIL